MRHELKKLSKRRYVSAIEVALVYAGLRDTRAAFAWLQKALSAARFCGRIPSRLTCSIIRCVANTPWRKRAGVASTDKITRLVVSGKPGDLHRCS